ncbi:MAG: hypothetical protein LUE96_07300 [Lachnospiraceae bacterium]|nr:hypothetical protein [Lachnospiraceae bacterium]
MSSSPDIIKDAASALEQVSDGGITVMQGWYDKDIKDCHVTLWDLGESENNFSDNEAEGVTLSVQVTIFSQEDEVELAHEIKSLMKEGGFEFEGRNGDDAEPEDGIYMKAQRFSKYYESEEE